MIRIIINGYKGRMGRALLDCAAHLPNCAVTGQVDQGDDLEAVLPQGDVVIGTTGHSAEEKANITKVASQIPIVWASNYSTGVNMLFWLTRKAAEVLGPDFDLEVVEMHHRLKKDAPSGTAATLLEILAEARRLQLPEALRHGRAGITGERSGQEIGVHSLRGGDVVGDHTVIFATNGERIELTHQASSRDTFANGALRAAQWVVGKPPAVYSMQDVLGLK